MTKWSDLKYDLKNGSPDKKAQGETQELLPQLYQDLSYDGLWLVAVLDLLFKDV